jgi:hypothetical protein
METFDKNKKNFWLISGESLMLALTVFISRPNGVISISVGQRPTNDVQNINQALKGR